MARYYPAFYLTDGIVGANRRNDPSDVKLLQNMFNALRRRAPSTWSGLGSLTADGRWSSVLEDHIRAFQQTGYGSNRLVVDGVIHPMRLTGSDLRSTFRSGVGSTLYALNVACMANAPRDHAAIGSTMNLRAITDVS